MINNYAIELLHHEPHKMIPVVAQDENLKIVLWHFKRRNYSKRLARF